jgi:hypothetical protein
MLSWMDLWRDRKAACQSPVATLAVLVAASLAAVDTARGGLADGPERTYPPERMVGARLSARLARGHTLAAGRPLRALFDVRRMIGVASFAMRWPISGSTSSISASTS